ncbi:hypothetical protein Ancab_033797 [Ancistrocladus abbreviatus]
MKPGVKITDGIESGIRNCKVGVAVFSPRYAESYFCLHELAFMTECKKKVIPIFCNVRPSELLRHVGDQCGSFTVADFHRFHWALQEGSHTVGLTFDTLKGVLDDDVAYDLELSRGSGWSCLDPRRVVFELFGNQLSGHVSQRGVQDSLGLV